MRYIGSKWNLLSHIEGVVDSLGVKEGIFCDLFAGTACVAAHFKRRGFRVISNDLLELSYTFQQALIANNEEPNFAGIVETLGDVQGDSLFANLSPYHTGRCLVELSSRQERIYLPQLLSSRK